MLLHWRSCRSTGHFCYWEWMAVYDTRNCGAVFCQHYLGYAKGMSSIEYPGLLANN